MGGVLRGSGGELRAVDEGADCEGDAEGGGCGRFREDGEAEFLCVGCMRVGRL